MFPGPGLPRLGFGTEYWADPRANAAYGPLIEAAAGRGEPVSPAYELTESLLSDVVHAACAIEYVASRIAVLIAEAEAYAAEIAPHVAREPRPEHGTYLSHRALEEAYFEFVNLLAWLRALEDRVDRKVPYSRLRAGLLPALAPATTLHQRVERLLIDLQHEVLEETRLLANYALHASAIPYPFHSHAEIVEGDLILRLPDPAVRQLNTKLDFTYAQGRSVQEFTARATAAVETFVDGLLEAFVAAIPARLRQPTA